MITKQEELFADIAYYENPNVLRSTLQDMGPYAKEAWDNSEEDRIHTSICQDGYCEWTYEHGCLWITCTCGAAWGVHDAIGQGTVDGFCFEQVSEGDR